MTSRAQQIEEIFEAFQALKRRLAMKHDRSSGAMTSLTPSQWCVLRVIAQSEGIGIKEIAARLDVTSSAATQLVGGLADKGFVARTADVRDHRAQKISTTPACRRKMRFLKEQSIRHLTKIFAALSADELTQYLRLHRKLAA